GPSDVSLSEMPGFSPDHSTVPEKTIGSAISLSSLSRRVEAPPRFCSDPTRNFSGPAWFLRTTKLREGHAARRYLCTARLSRSGRPVLPRVAGNAWLPSFALEGWSISGLHDG